MFFSRLKGFVVVFKLVWRFLNNQVNLYCKVKINIKILNVKLYFSENFYFFIQIETLKW